MKRKDLTLKAGAPTPVIDWALVDSLPLADMPDKDSPELTAKAFSELRPASEALPDLTTGKTRITIMLDSAVLQAYKVRAGGRGYQTLINETLRRGIEVDGVAEVLRKVLREELHT